MPNPIQPWPQPRLSIYGLVRAARGGLGAAATAPAIATLVQQAAIRYGVDPALALAVAQRESGLNPNAVSPTGAQGVMQLEPPTAAQYGVTNPFDPVQNVNAGVHYLADLLGQYGGDVAKAVAAYDWGPGNLNRAIASYGGNWLSAAPTETQNYVAAITGVTAESNAPAPAVQQPSQQIAAPVTIDASTGLPVVDGTDVSQLDTVNAGIIPTTQPLVYGGLALGAIVLATLLTRD
jgi:Transglycosylase SLT domain